MIPFPKCSYALPVLDCGLFASRAIYKSTMYVCMLNVLYNVTDPVDLVCDINIENIMVLYFFYTGPRFTEPLMYHRKAVTKDGCICV